ncbi:hypothetical protein HNQ94_003338 [Salirhabdus euzebyi]|uniref:YkyB-like protein n=1 Tax=Salirhabdus euzebyi TaxID=394506 RepID=A0A841Q8C1_9BACI|nr:YkyB family protein [Salirhabdus euzebyi]MBB6454849.1 hypothetical protein [Salirhabdus euzebyi]
MNKENKEYTVKEIAEALAVVNRHAKAAPDPRHLYDIKKNAIEKLLEQKKAKKIGLHYSNHPKLSQQHSTLLIQVGDYFFHLPPKREDLKELKHLGALDETYRNPKPQLNLKKSKAILYDYLNWKPPVEKKPSYAYTPSISSWVSGGKQNNSRKYFNR